MATAKLKFSQKKTPTLKIKSYKAAKIKEV